MRSLLLAATLVGFTLVFSAPLAAQNTFEYGVDLSVDQLVATDRVVNSNADPVQLVIDNPPYGSAAGRAHVSPGVNKAASRLNLVSTLANPTGIGYANAYAFWYDLVTIDDPTQNGQPGTFTASMLVNGAGNVTAAGPWTNLDYFDDMYAVWTAYVGVFIDGNHQEGGWYGFWEINPTTGQMEYDGAPLGQMQSQITFGFTFGEPFVLSGRLQTYMLVSTPSMLPGTFDGDVDLGNSAYWGGIGNIRTAAGQPVNGASITSASGVQWGNAIDPRFTRGDFDLSGAVTLDDFNILAAYFGSTGTPWTRADATGDGLVNLRDFNVLASNFGLPSLTSEPTPEDWSTLAAAIPEPGLATAGLAATLLATARRRRS